VSIYECSSCGFGFQPEQPDNVAGLYGNEYFETYEGGRPYQRNEAERRLEARVRLRFVRRFSPDGRLLELGAAAGYFVAEAARAGFDAVGIEPNAAMVQIACERLSADVRRGLAEEAGSLFDNLDVVCGWHILEHLGSPVETLTSLRAAMAPNGLIFFEVPNFASARARRERGNWRYLDPLHHIGQYTPRAIRKLLERTGFEPVEVLTIPWSEYKRWPRSLLSYGKQAIVVGASTFRPDPWKHELLRAVARHRV
jgi:SAM-dependent methyltransferase